MKVFIATDGIYPLAIGGIQRYSRLIVEELAKNETLQLTVAHPHKGELLFEDFERVQEITVDDIDLSKNYLKECYNYSKRVHAEIIKTDYDVVYAQGFTVWYKIKDFKGRLINNPHGLECFQALTTKSKLVGIPFRKVQKYIFNNSDIVCSEGGWLTKILHSLVGEEKVEFVPNAVNLPIKASLKEKPKSKEPLRLFFIARFASNKGIHILMQAVKELNDEGYENDFNFKLGGKGPLYEEYIEKYKYSNVQFLGFVSDEELAENYEKADVFVFPTLFEGMPTVILEAMSNYLPIIVSDTGGTSELVDENNGYLIQPGEVDQVKNAILSYWKLSAEQKNQLSNSSFEKVSNNFTWKKVAEKHIDLFSKITRNDIYDAQQDNEA